RMRVHLPLGVAWSCARRNASVGSSSRDSLDSFITNLSKAHVTGRVLRSSVEVEKLIDDQKASALDRLNYIITLPLLVSKPQLSRIRMDSFSTEFSSTVFSKDDLIAALDKMCKLRATDTQTYRALMRVLSSMSPSSLQSVSLCPLVEVICANEELNLIEDEEWKSEARMIVAESIKASTLPTELIYILRRTNVWKNECIEAVKNNFKSMSFTDKVSLLSVLSSRGNVDAVFVNTMVEDIASDSTPLTFRQCVNLASTCMLLKLNSSRLKTKLIKETMAGMGSMTKFNDARTILTLFTIWRVTHDAVWKQLSVWTERRAKEAPFKDVSAVVNMMCDLGRGEGAETASILSGRMCMERGGDALIWLKTMVSLSFYSCIDHRSIESVLNPVFIEEALSHKSTRRDVFIRLLMNVDYYAWTLDSYDGPRLKEGFISENDVASIVSSYCSRMNEVEAFRSCLSRVIVDPSQSHPQLHPSGLTLEALFTNPKGGDEAIVFVPSNQYAEDGNGERMMGSYLLPVRCMEKKGIKVHTFTHREMASFNSQVEATMYIKKKVLGK
ncbi:hypothetical protein PENTCL1PPCAC_30380, partial [Pristionchus entomophagus]